MTLYNIYAGLSGGFGGAKLVDSVSCDTREEAEEIAYGYACEEYDYYAGTRGIRSTSDIMDEENCYEEEADQIYLEEMEGWMDYYAITTEEDKNDE